MTGLFFKFKQVKSILLKIILIAIIPVVVFYSFNSSVASGDDLRKDVILDTTYSNLPVLHLDGTPYENGFQHGKIMKSRIFELVGLWKEDLERNYGMPADTFIKIFLESTDYIPSIRKWCLSPLNSWRKILLISSSKLVGQNEQKSIHS
jgi:hypothetical protein